MKYSFKKRQRERKIERIVKELERVRWQYRNIILFAISFAIAYFVVKTENFYDFISRLAGVAYLGSFFSGLFYTFSLTVLPSAASFYKLGKILNPALVAGIGAFGALVGDYFIFRFVKDKLVEEIKLLINNTGQKVVYSFKNSVFYGLFPFSNIALSENFRRIWFKVSRSKKWKILISLIGFGIIASPLPDELGITLLGSIKLDSKRFILFSYFLNFLGIFLISSLIF